MDLGESSQSGRGANNGALLAEGVRVIYYHACGVGGGFSWDLHEITIDVPLS